MNFTRKELTNQNKTIMENQLTNLKTIKNYANSVILDSTGNNPTVQYIYKLIDSGAVTSKEIDGVKFIDYSLDVKGISKIDN